MQTSPLHYRKAPSLALLSLLCIDAVACGNGSVPPTADRGAAATPVPDEGQARDGDRSSPDSGVSSLAPLPANWGPEHCPAPGVPGAGFDVGDTIGDLGLRDCDTGARVTMDEMCGASATWVFVAHTHCPTCQATAGFTDEVAAAVAQKNVAIVHVVHDDNGTSCAKWRSAYKLSALSNVRVYADPEGTIWAKLKTKNYTAPSAFLDARRVITFKEHSLSRRSVLTQIDAALSNAP